ncbi:Catalytic LigB subunit of aromatic ring-opening dioxygenase [Geosmithia morbida]|uniref:Catalytic LigB subunit of aromatic ring-opening dioxygenase n=1 Tax=Geosmithia morbida TaxID=1094350 RepID=A0A9P4YQ32_9HYPO|nr:Catalytic LigB subunit of aromatic ring-opening dioxygenase [Geosmithia morbida]KAF4119709.1 Catalytic LigB subunit of aromatic ring-opening dioxygenase [Geosmithia morbida]
MSKLAPVIALSHGGGPMPLLSDPSHRFIVQSLQERVPKILSLHGTDRPRAILLVTAHWTTASPTVTSGRNPDLIYDYYGFPPESYEIEYPARGEPEVAAEVAAAMQAEGLEGVRQDADRGWDHGVFVPLKLVEPDAGSIPPIVQVSVLAGEDPVLHLRMGRALRGLRARGVAVVGSGFASFHNLRLMMSAMASSSPDPDLLETSRRWNEAVTAAVSLPREPDRWDALARWRDMPGGKVMHPPRRGEHFLPLLVCAGAASDGEQAGFYKDLFAGFEIYTYYWADVDV